MPHITVRRSSTQRSVLASLLVLTVSAVLVLAGTPGYAFPTADEDMSFSISSDIVVKDEDTFSVKLTMSESESVPVLSESVCDKGSPDSSNSSIKDLKVNFKSENGTRTCTMEGTGSITSSSKNVRHKGDEFIVQTLNFDDFPSGVSADVTQSVTFPGKVTEADGGTVEGTKVSFNDNDQHEVKGKDKPAKSAATGSSQDAAGEDDSGSIPVWVWRLIGSLAVAIVGGVAGMLVMMQRKKKQSQLAAYTAAAQVYDPNQAFPGQPMQQPYQPGYAEPTAQPYQPGYTEPYQQGQPTPQPYQPGQPGQQPYQPGYAEPTAQPYQPGYTEPYQQPYNNQPGQPGQGF
ncbi:LppM family (lipo)protein [Actinomyces oris]|uniref:LppM family (lipo)protein n=2 Tax=Actinomyces TaxID=1654 RepID=UPI00094D4B4B|nr:viral protein TPX [Actinomyces oris]OLO55746.1 viral protein TPX [Actinomyces oris]OLO63041.1 viral protein TPX [Actinomyces oris]